MAERSAQDAWLDDLGEATQLTEWVASFFIDQLHGAVLEIGCGIGNFTAHLASRATEVTAIDINADYVHATADRLQTCNNVMVCHGDATKMDWSRRYNAIVMLDVLEHVEDDIGLLRHLSSALVPGGLLVLKVPAAPRLYTQMDKAIGHYRRYSRRGLARLLQRGGYVVERQRYFNFAGMVGWWLNGAVLRRDVAPSGQIALFERLVPFLRRAEANLSLPIGLSLITIARTSQTATGFG